ncbi:MAG: tRNA preQ1(34) S-adenosylmethionine ribosyltransferase-isomerase QueA [Legionellaceae bacterium]|nr:tRNA preQ1(34) S-adenosylmethionine ribosyltransferase-isomerase QueA [Legionellaceae bacterium]HCA90233.1 tRNA preQ1(34) S-adenosylmethionine ribosyltransferase-isomerase QueA [Legionellales bacterium]|tara:strand:+ start:7017 stop:8030 length:1014 start_codon:yes stop_codon:yes gene_type:complete
MNTQDFDFDLPAELIAQYPLEERRASRLLYFNRQTKNHEHSSVASIANYLKPGDLLVMNDSKVIPARFFGKKETGGQVEFLVERLLDAHTFLAHIKASKALKPGMKVIINAKWQVEIIAKHDDLYHCRVSGYISELMDEVGHMPLPPYITRCDSAFDKTRYQTVYARYDGSVAAPTAGLHFDQALLTQLEEKGVELGYVTLHVGAGTFRPVRVETLAEHTMHAEQFTVSQALCTQIQATKARGGRVIAVGTTSMRSLESAAQNGELKACTKETRIFIYPGFKFQVCDGLLTNFHLPQSTLIMLVAAFIGQTQTKALYQTAINAGYRFFSYGDTSLLL